MAEAQQTAGQTRPTDTNHQVVSALGALFIPSRPGDPGYKELEPQGITDYVLRDFPVDGIETFNAAARESFGGKTFLELDEAQKTEYLQLVVGSTRVAGRDRPADGRALEPPEDFSGAKPAPPARTITNAEQRTRVVRFYRTARVRILRAYYSNFPEHRLQRDAQGVPIARPGETHQNYNPNTKTVVTGWDVAGYPGPPATWAEEEKLRAEAKKKLPHWFEGDLVALNPKRPPAASPTKTASGHDYYDVIVLGGGTSGCIIAGRLAERGINPKTGDRLRVALIEGGDDWMIRDPAIRPGYGMPIRRQMINRIEGLGAAYRWPGDTRSNFKIIGGCSNHFGATVWIPGDEDFRFYREASGVNWDLAKFGDAIQEVRDIYGVAQSADSFWTKGDHVWADGARALGLDVRVREGGFRNVMNYGQAGSLNRYDSKGTSLPWAYIGMNNGLKIIANAEVEKILIEKPAGGRPVAVGAVYKDKDGTMHEVRAARVVAALGCVFLPLVLYKSGYGPKDLLGTNLLVENDNVGRHLSGDVNLVSAAYLEEPVTPEGVMDVPNASVWAALQKRPWPELSVHVDGEPAGRNPAGAAADVFAPEFGWDHKEFMRNGFGMRHIYTWRSHVGVIPATWRVTPDRKVPLEKMDEARCRATARETKEIIQAWMGKLAVKPLRVAHGNNYVRDPKEWPPQHRASSCRAGSSRENSVCSSDFDSHDIDHLLLSSGAVTPKTFFWSAGPVASGACYAWRRMIANHFSRGCSTRGFA